QRDRRSPRVQGRLRVPLRVRLGGQALERLRLLARGQEGRVAQGALVERHRLAVGASGGGGPRGGQRVPSQRVVARRLGVVDQASRFHAAPLEDVQNRAIELQPAERRKRVLVRVAGELVPESQRLAFQEKQSGALGLGDGRAGVAEVLLDEPELRLT